jgi:hypothetical protein
MHWSKAAARGLITFIETYCAPVDEEGAFFAHHIDQIKALHPGALIIC